MNKHQNVALYQRLGEKNQTVEIIFQGKNMADTNKHI